MSPSQWKGSVPSSPTWTACVRRSPTVSNFQTLSAIFRALRMAGRAGDAAARVAVEELVPGVEHAVAAERDHDRRVEHVAKT